MAIRFVRSKEDSSESGIEIYRVLVDGRNVGAAYPEHHDVYIDLGNLEEFITNEVSAAYEKRWGSIPTFVD